MKYKMPAAQYITWLFKMAKAEEHHDNHRNAYLKQALSVNLNEY